jgi:diguanylate cyclase (GGDEF)-like protein/PAS domain S-box-containing protein
MADLEAEQRRFRRMIDSSPQGFVEVDDSLRFTEWNQRATEMLGWTRDEIVGRSIFEVVTTRHVDVVEQGIAVLRAETEKGGNPESLAPMTFEMEMRHRDGSTVVMSGRVVVTRIGDELRVGGFGEIKPVTAPLREPGSQDRLHDNLTGLPSRALFTRRLAVAIRGLRRTGGSVAVAAIDLDRFKVINDTMGHDAGDDVLISAVARLRQAGGVIKPLLARLGGDEFLALFESDDDGARAEAERFSRRALAVLEEPFFVGGNEVFLTASVGIAFTADSETGATRLLSNAGGALHETKAAGGASLTVYGDAIRRHVVERMSTEHSLHHALNRGELRVLYQPVVDIRGADVLAGAEPETPQPSSTIAVEALVRWCPAEQEMVEPERFIPVAEESGLIVPIGTWVLREACEQMYRWRHAGIGGPTSAVEVNLSARQIDQPDLVPTVEQILAQSGLAPEHLTLEITESALMRDGRAALLVLQALKSIGVSLAIDDFGTGYSSLSYLQRFPLDILKIDKSFVDDLSLGQGVEIVSAVIELAHALGLEVVAEGVETRHQLEVLQGLACDYAQGFLFSKPVHAFELGKHLPMGA